MIYPKEFFAINLRFAYKISEISQEPIAETLLHYTNLYIRFSIGRDFDPNHPIWQEYLAGLHQAQDSTEWTYSLYLKRQEGFSPKLGMSPFGCFSYTILDRNRIRLHFHNEVMSGDSPLKRDQIEQRFAELRNMFSHIKHNVDNPTNVVGASWLYNLEAYRRLFPPAYLATAKVSDKDFAYLPLWGQFIDHSGCAKEYLIAQFLERVDKLHGIEHAMSCFPLQVLYLESSIQDFYPFYDVQARPIYRG